MLQTLKDLFAAVRPAELAEPEASEHALQLATAVLLIEVMRADAQSDATEQATALALLREHFTLRSDELERLYELAEARADEATDLHTFTLQLDKTFDAPQKTRILELLWRVAYADGKLCAHEAHLMRKLADLLHVPYAAYIGTKLRAAGESS
jgi:uncharacterized tellurite resistance protein B-like protein